MAMQVNNANYQYCLLLFLLYLHKLNLEDESRESRDFSGCTTAIGKVVRDIKLPFATFWHKVKSFCPAFYYFRRRELCCLRITLVAAVKDSAIKESAFI